MAVTATLFDHFREKLLTLVNPIDFAADDIRVALVTSAYTPDRAAHEFWDDVTGDAPRRSLASESANPPIAVDMPAVRYAMSTDPEQSTPTPTAPVTIVAQLSDGTTNLKTSGIALRWDLFIGDGMAETDPTDTTLAYYLEDATGTTDQYGKAYTIAHTGAAYDPAAGLACTVEAVTEAPP